MGKDRITAEDISVYVANKESTANRYVMRCFTVSIVLYAFCFLLNQLDIFIIDKTVMTRSCILILIGYFIIFAVTKFVSLSNEKVKYIILFGAIFIYTIMGMHVTYHVVLMSMLPFLYAVLYSSQRVMRYVYFLTVISTICIVYGGYYWGLCDANMALLTCGPLQDYEVNGQFTLTEINTNPILTLGLYYIVPRCLIYIAYMFICNNIFRIISGSFEKVQLTNELEQAKIAAEKANRAKSDFLTKMSHEIRTPINAVLGINEMILRESGEPETKKYAMDIKSSANSLLSIINEILDSSKIESGKMEIVPDNYEMRTLLNDLYNMTSVRAKDKGLELVFDVDAAVPSEYFGDDVRIRQVLVNLLTNAVKYTPKGNVTMTVTGEVAGENAILHYAVKDTGIGIKEEDISKLFSEFQRIEEVKNRYVEGTGLGLNIAMQLLKLMGSELKVKSEYGKGSEFSFTIVQKIVNAEPLGDFEEKNRQTATEYIYEVSYIAPDARVLAVDDNEINRKVFRNLLKHTRMQVYEAGSGRECITMVERQSFDIIFLDHMMPDMDGVETLRIMRDKKLCENVPVIMLTANAIIGAREEYLKEGFADYLTKPIVPDKLDKMILQYLSPELVRDGNDRKAVKQIKGMGALPEIEGFSFDSVRLLLGSEKLLLEVLEDFYHSLDTVQQRLTALFASIDTEEAMVAYRTEVQGLKSTAATVGARALSQCARKLEAAADNRDADKLRKLHPMLIEELARHRERLAAILS